MAGPTVVVKVLGDTKGLSGAFTDAGKQAEGSSGRIHAAFTSVLGTLNQSGVLGPFAGSLQAVDDAFANLEGQGRRVGQVMLGLGGAFAGVGFGLSVIGSQDQAARQQLQAAIEATGASWDDYNAKVDEAVKHNERFGDSAAKTQNALQILTQATGSPQKALDLLGVATDLAAAKHESLTDAATQLGKVYNGNAKLLKQFGINITSSATATRAADTATRRADASDTALAAAKQRLSDLEAIDASKKSLTTTQAVRLHDAQLKVQAATTTAVGAHKRLTTAQQAAAAAAKGQGGAVDQLGAKLKGQAAAASDTFAGKLKAVTTVIEDQAAKFGNKYGPALQVAGQGVAVLGAGFEAGGKLAKKFGDGQKAVGDAQKLAAEGGKLQKVALVGVAGAEALAGGAGIGMLATLGLIVLAVLALVAVGYVIYRNWGTIWAFIKRIVKDVFDWIKHNWPLLLAILVGPIGLAVLAIVRHWHAIMDGFTAVKDWIVARWNDIVRFFTGIPGTIARIAKGMWDGIANAFVDVINFIIHIWNGLQFKVPSVGFGPFHTPSFTLGLPNIPNVPRLAQGGLITQTGLVFAHAGEAITPAPARTGPAVAIANAHFSSEVDVEAFMRRAAWVIKTQGV